MPALPWTSPRRASLISRLTPTRAMRRWNWRGTDDRSCGRRIAARLITGVDYLDPADRADETAATLRSALHRKPAILHLTQQPASQSFSRTRSAVRDGSDHRGRIRRERVAVKAD